MMRSSVVLPDPEGPSRAMNSPFWMVWLTSLSAVNWLKVLVMPIAWRLMMELPWLLMSTAAGETAPDAPFQQALADEGDQRQQRQQRGDRERADEVVLVVEDLDM